MSNIEEFKRKKTLVYFASGPYKKSYEYLPYDQIYLVDYCFATRNKTGIEFSKSGKVMCLGEDCLQAVNYFKQNNIKIDAYIALNEGLYEGGGSYSLQSDLFLGFVMSILNDEYIHIVNKNYYGHQYHVTMDLPFEKAEIHLGEPDYLDPFLFSSDIYHKGHAKVYRMKKKQVSAFELKINPDIKVSINHDSIWCYAEELDLLAISFTPQGQGEYLNRINKVYSLRENSIADVMEHCVQHKLERIGITPWGHGHYNEFIDLIKSYNKEYPKEITLFHLNRKDFETLKDLA